MRWLNQARRLKGVTLVEVLVAMMILGLVIPMIMGTFVSTIFLNESNRNMCIASQHAQFMLEDIKDVDPAQVSSRIGNDDWDWSSAEVNATGLTALKDETITTQVSGTELLTVNATVGWSDRSNRGRNVTIDTYIFVP